MPHCKTKQLLPIKNEFYAHYDTIYAKQYYQYCTEAFTVLETFAPSITHSIFEMFIQINNHLLDDHDEKYRITQL